MQQIGEYKAGFTGGTVVDNITILKRIFSQLNNRKKEWPINWTIKHPGLLPKDYFYFYR